MAPKISLIISPSLFIPEPITLPYEYCSLTLETPKPLEEVFECISDIKTSSLNHYEHLNKKFLIWSERLKQWEASAEARYLYEIRKIAPGYLDTNERLLQPTLTKPSSTP
ncbi:hypothetical protein PNEG_01466 [Pneumocystis murina B123]|uniref:Uncharacterized protein n=1 Tax=Pneumocystis murina (strain B123) TaxID=1069680 RepID=M7NNC4_PNEMU|nr:hypothetical protein PNEG_01466 [Pneumocystis murina B123]EMR10193.1 hypothetical protein PNEG_01466 [Pneumocystis murina B123]